MLPFRSEIRNSPSHPTIKIFLSDESLVPSIQKHLDNFEDIEFAEIRKTYGRNREGDNITVYLKDDVDINQLKSAIDSSLWWYFEEDLVDE